MRDNAALPAQGPSTRADGIQKAARRVVQSCLVALGYIVLTPNHEDTGTGVLSKHGHSSFQHTFSKACALERETGRQVKNNSVLKDLRSNSASLPFTQHTAPFIQEVVGMEMLCAAMAVTKFTAPVQVIDYTCCTLPNNF